MTQIDPGTSAWLRAHNDRTAFRLILEHGPLTRTQLGELSGMSKPTTLTSPGTSRPASRRAPLAWSLSIAG